MTDPRGLTLNGPAAQGESFSDIFRVFDRDSEQCVRVIGGRRKAYAWAKRYSLENNKVAKVKNGAIPCATFINGSRYD